MLTFELSDTSRVIEIHGDSDGLKELSGLLLELANDSESNHVHIMGPDFGGEDLDGEKQGINNDLINHVKIFVWK